MVTRTVILVPREPTYTLPEVAYEKTRKRYCRMVDDPPSRTTENSADEVIFDRLPLQPQVYDMLSYFHRLHAPLPPGRQTMTSKEAKTKS